MLDRSTHIFGCVSSDISEFSLKPTNYGLINKSFTIWTNKFSKNKEWYQGVQNKDIICPRSYLEEASQVTIENSRKIIKSLIKERDFKKIKKIEKKIKKIRRNEFEICLSKNYKLFGNKSHQKNGPEERKF